MTTATKNKRRVGVSLQVDDLKRALETVMPAVPVKTTKPILHNVRIGDGVMTATSLELQITTPVDYHGDAILLPASRLWSILKAIPGSTGEMTLTPSGSTCLIAAGRCSWTLPTEDAAEFPTWEPQNPQPVVRIPPDQFSRAVAGVVYATDDESNRYALGGVLLDWSDGIATLVGTDGRRMSTVEIEVDQATEKAQVLVPANAIHQMARAAGSREVAVQIETTSSEVICEIEGTVITARLLDGRFPKWRDVVPERDGVKPTLVGAGTLLAAVRQAAICSSEQSKGVEFTFSAKGIQLAARSAEAGESSVECEIVEAGSETTAKLDPRFVAEFLKPLDPAETVEVEADGPASAVVFRCGESVGVIMPLAVD